MNPLRNEKGFSVLLLALMILLVMTALGIAALQTSQRELKAVTKLKLSTQAFYSAESGVQLATAEISAIKADNIDEFDNVIVDWKDELLSQYKQMQIDDYVPTQTKFTFTEELYSLTSMKFETTVSFIGTGTDILCYGKKGSAFVFENASLQEFYDAEDKHIGRDFWPILTITSTGMHGNNEASLFKYAERNVQIMLRTEPSFSFPEAAMTLNGDLDPNGTPNSIVGEGKEEECSVEDIIGLPGKALDYVGNTGWNPDDGVACKPEIDYEAIPEGEECPCKGEKQIGLSQDSEGNPIPYPVDDVVATLIRYGTPIDPTNGPLSLGSDTPGDDNNIYYYKGDIQYEDTFEQNNIEGYGILVINGDLDLGGKIEWRGMIIVTGDVRLHGGGGNTRYIEGVLIAGGNVTVSGNPDIYFDCSRLEDLWKNSTAWNMKWWKEIKGRIEHPY